MFFYQPHFIPSAVIVYGAGGTGGWLIPRVAQFLRSITKSENPQGWLVNPTMWVVDADQVEPKNLWRQNFIDCDIGRNKAVVLAERYSRAYHINIQACQNFIHEEGTIGEQHITSSTEFHQFLGDSSEKGCIHVMCVDSPDARRNILRLIRRYFYNKGNQFIIDPGNEATFGQVRFFHSVTADANYNNDIEVYADRIKNLEFRPERVAIPFIPLDHEYYASLTAGPDELSCADLDQTMAINNEMGAVCFSIIQNFFFAQPLTYRQVNVSLTGGRNTVLLTAEDVRNQCQTASSIYGFTGLNLRDVLYNYWVVQKTSVDKALAAEAKLELKRKRAAEKVKAKAEAAKKAEHQEVTPALESAVETAEPAKPVRSRKPKTEALPLEPVTLATPVPSVALLPEGMTERPPLERIS